MRRRLLLTCVLASLLALPLAARAALAPDLHEATLTQPMERGHRVPIPYVIVTTKALRPEFLRLAAAHTRAGLHATVQTLESIRASYPAAADDAERIRLFLQDAHREWGLQWLLVGGDASVIPMRRAALWVPSLNLSDPRVFLPTDQYYACLEGTWNADGDSLWGEIADDQPDATPELRVGRAPVATAEEARRFVTKTIWALEGRRADAGHRVLLATGWNMAALSHSMEVFRSLFEAAPGTEITRLYWDWNQWPGASPISRDTLLDALNQGPGLAVLGHFGGPGVIKIGEADTIEDQISTADLLALRNGLRLTRYAFLAGYTCAPDSGLSIASALMNAPHGGAVAVLGLTYTAYAGILFTYVRSFIQALTDGGAVTGGEALTRADLSDPYPVETVRLVTLGLTLFGDPALPWWDAPASTSQPLVSEPSERSSTTDAAPGSLVLDAPRPNPAVACVRVELSVPVASAGSPFEVIVFDLAGRKVRTLAQGLAPAGRHTLMWDLERADGRPVGPGLYFIRSMVGGEVRTRRVVVER